jgi:hypothetical protein
VCTVKDYRGIEYLLWLFVNNYKRPWSLGVLDVYIKSFIRRNVHQKKMKREGGDDSFELQEFPPLEWDNFWEILLTATDERVFKSALDFLIRLTQRLSPRLKRDVNEVRRAFLQKCFALLKSAQKDRLDRCIVVLKVCAPDLCIFFFFILHAPDLPRKRTSSSP